MTLAGFPTAIVIFGIFFVTTEPAYIIVLISWSVGWIAVKSPVTGPIRMLYPMSIYSRSIIEMLKFIKNSSPINILSP